MRLQELGSFVKEQENNIVFDAFQTEKLLIRCMGTIDRLVTIAFLTQPLKTGEFKSDKQDNHRRRFRHSIKSVWFHVVTIVLLMERRLDIVVV